VNAFMRGGMGLNNISHTDALLAAAGQPMLNVGQSLGAFFGANDYSHNPAHAALAQGATPNNAASFQAYDPNNGRPLGSTDYMTRLTYALAGPGALNNGGGGRGNAGGVSGPGDAGPGGMLGHI
jgi:hypothetical protein